MINKMTNGDIRIRTRRHKRSISPNQSLINDRKSKATKIDSQQDVTNKENIIKRVQSEMVLSKHSSLIFVNNEDSSDTSWYQSHPLLSNLMTKTLDKTYKCRLNFLDSHPLITTKMRSILFDWLIEVCEVYHLHRETYHLAISYIDQYLNRTENFVKNKFQLLGITAIFVASKIEEIYPPHLNDFAYVTDHTCSEQDILDMELELMNKLNWYINPITSISWLLVYLQTEYDIENLKNKIDFSNKKRRLSLTNSEILQYSKLSNIHQSNDFMQIFSLIVRLIDLCSLDIEYSHFSKHIIAASAILFYKPNSSIRNLTGLTDDDSLKICREWMKPFYEILSESSSSITNPSIRSSPSVPTDEVYSLQIHNVSMDLLENIYEKRAKSGSIFNNNRPLRDVLNHISWLPNLSEKNEITILV